MHHPIAKTKKQIYNQKYADANGDKMRENACINYGQNREKMLLKRAYDRYLNNCKLRKNTCDRLVAAGYFISLYHTPRYLQSSK